MGPAFFGVVANVAISYAINIVANKLFGPKEPEKKFNALQTHCDPDLPIPTVYGRRKLAGNIIWSKKGSNRIADRVVSFGTGPIQGISAVCFNDLVVSPDGETPVVIARIQNTLYADATIQIVGGGPTPDDKTLRLYANGTTTSIILCDPVDIGKETLEDYNATVKGILAHVAEIGNGWTVLDPISSNNPAEHINNIAVTPCYSAPASITIDGIKDCSYIAYTGNGTQLIDDRVPGETQEIKAALIGGMRHEAYIALTAKASDTLNADFNVTAIVTGKLVRIYSNTTTYTVAWSDNPAWCILDFLLDYNGCALTVDEVDIQSFIDAAAYCDELVDGQPRFTLNIAINETKTRQDWLNEMLFTCRAYPTYQRGKHGILIEKPEAVAQAFTVLPTEELEFWWSPIEEEIDRLELKFTDPVYEWVQVPAVAEVASTHTRIISKEVEVDGITNFPQASRQAWFYSNQSQTCKQWARYKTNRRAMNRSIGEVISLTDPITGFVDKKYRIMGMTEPQGLAIELLLREYNENLYTDQVAGVRPAVNITTLTNPTAVPPEVTDIVLSQVYYRLKDGTIVSYITGTCVLPDYAHFSEANLSYSTDGVNWTDGGRVATDGSFVISNTQTGTNYTIKIKVRSKLGLVSAGVTSVPIYITGKDNPPSDIATLTATIDPSDRTKITLNWSEVDDIDLRGYRLLEGSTNLTPTPISDTRYVFTATQSRQHNFSVVAIDNSGNPSAVPAIKALAVTVEPPNVTGFTAVPQETDRSQLILNWSAVQAQDLSYYEIRQGADGWDTAEVIATQLKTTRYVHPLTSEGYQTYMVKAYAVGGHASASPASASLQVILRPDTPTNLTAAQEPRDKSMLKLSWTASPGKDIAAYDIYNGTVLIASEKNTTFWWAVPTSGTYTLSVRARTVAGKVSNAINVTVSPMIEADDVTGFVAVQQISDRTRVRLMWDASSGDIAYHEIRKGVSWDAGAVIGQRVTGTFFDTIVLDEALQTYWIKSVTTAGKYSQNPVKTEGVFNLNPLPVSNIQLAQDPNDRSVLNIAFEATPEADLANYEIRKGYVWQDSPVIGETKELRWTDRLEQTGDVKIMIKAKNAAGYYSDEVSASLYCTVEPSNVTGFRVFQNGERLAFIWNPIPDNDVVGYVLREGGNFDNGTIIADGITLNQYQLFVDTEILRRFHIKAVNRAGHKSRFETSVSVLITDLPPKNVIQTYDEIALKSGVHNGTEFGPSLLNFSTLGGRFSDYSTTKFSDIGGADVLKLARRSTASFARTSAAYDLSGNQALANIPRFTPDGLRQDEATTNLLSASDSQSFSTPVTVTVTVGTVYTISCTNGIISISGAGNGTVTSSLPLKITAATTSLTLTPEGTVTLCQVEAKAFRTAWQIGGIPRTREVLKLPNSLIGLTQGAIVFDVITHDNWNAVGNTYLFYANSATTNRFYICKTSNEGVQLGINNTDNGGVTKATASSPAFTFANNSKHRIGVSWNVNGDAVLYVDGINRGVLTMNGASFNAFTTVTMGYYTPSYSQNFTIANVWVSSVARTEAEMLNTGQMPIDENVTYFRFTDSLISDYFLTGEYIVERKDMGKLITANTTTVFQPSILYATGTTASLEFRTSRDGNTWTDWAPFSPLEATFRYADFRVLLSTQDTTKTPEVNQLRFRIDVPDTVISKTVDVPVGGMTFEYGHDYYEVPVVTTTADGNKLAKRSSKTKSNIFLQVVDADTKADVGGQVDVIAKGY